MESPPSAPAAARGPAPGGQESEQRRRAVEVGTHLKKVIDAYRMFESGHEAQGALEEVLWDRLRSYLDRFGDLSLELSATTISIEGKDVITASRPEESITFALFIDGIHEVLILKGIERPELVAFLRLWSEAAKRPDEGATPIREDESVLTRFWEADFENVELVAMEATAESASSESDAEMQERHQELRRVMRSMAGSLPDGTRTTRDGGAFGEAFWSVGAGAESPGAHRDESRRPADDPIALRMWQAELGVAVDAASIANPGPPRAAPIRDEDRELFAARVEAAWDEHVVERFLAAAFALTADAAPEDVEAMATPVSRVVAASIAAGELGRLGEALVAAQRSAMAGGATGNEAFVAFERLRVSLEAAEVLEPALSAMDAPAQREGALRLVSLLRPEGLGAVLDRLDRVSERRALEALVALVLSRHPPPEALTRAAASAPPDAAVVLLHQLGGRDDALARVVRRSALRHPDGSVRARSLETMSAAARAEAVAELRQLTMDPDEAVRGAALLCCVELRDRGVIPRLSALLDGRLGARSAQQAATALGHLGGMDGAIALRRAFLTSRHAEVKAACAIALAEIGDESARAMIEKEAARFLHRGSLKAACVEALRRLDARRGGH